MPKGSSIAVCAQSRGWAGLTRPLDGEWAALVPHQISQAALENANLRRGSRGALTTEPGAGWLPPSKLLRVNLCPTARLSGMLGMYFARLTEPNHSG